MKKKTSQNNKVKKNTSQKQVSRAVPSECKQCFSPWSLSIYVYWFIVLFFIAATFYILGRSHGAITPSVANNVEITEEALKQGNDYFENGKINLVNGNIEDAISDLTVAIEANPTLVDAFILRGEAYMQSADYRAAMADFNAAIEMDAENAVAFYDRALLYIRLEDYSAALNDINNALAASVKRPNSILSQRDLYAKRGQLNLWMKNWNGAIADYTNSLARPDGFVNPSVYAERAEAYTAVGEYVNAINDYASAVRIISEQIQAATTMADRESQSSNAMSYFEKSAALNLQLGNVEAAHADLQSAITIAMALNDVETVERLQGLIQKLPLE